MRDLFNHMVYCEGLSEKINDKIIKIWDDTGLLYGLNDIEKKLICILSFENMRYCIMQKQVILDDSEYAERLATIIFPVIRRLLINCNYTKEFSIQECIDIFNTLNNFLRCDFDLFCDFTFFMGRIFD